MGKSWEAMWPLLYLFHFFFFSFFFFLPFSFFLSFPFKFWPIRHHITISISLPLYRCHVASSTTNSPSSSSIFPSFSSSTIATTLHDLAVCQHRKGACATLKRLAFAKAWCATIHPRGLHVPPWFSTVLLPSVHFLQSTQTFWNPHSKSFPRYLYCQVKVAKKYWHAFLCNYNFPAKW